MPNLEPHIDVESRCRAHAVAAAAGHSVRNAVAGVGDANTIGKSISEQATATAQRDESFQIVKILHGKELKCSTGSWGVFSPGVQRVTCCERSLSGGGCGGGKEGRRVLLVRHDRDGGGGTGQMVEVVRIVMFLKIVAEKVVVCVGEGGGGGERSSSSRMRRATSPFFSQRNFTSQFQQQNRHEKGCSTSLSVWQ
jgi:hypothetical protein